MSRRDGRRRGVAAGDRYDVAVIGAGVGGLTVAIGMARAGRRVALIERAAVGGDCTNVGCIPSKTLLELASRSTASADSDRATEVLAEVRRVRDAVRAHDEALLAAEAPRLTLLHAEARLRAGPGVPAVELVAGQGTAGHHSRVLHATRVVLATGSRPVVVDLDGATGERILTNETAFELVTPPAGLVVLGAGATGCELALAFARLGSRVTMIEPREHILADLDTDAAAAVVRGLERAGVRVLTRASARRLDGATLEVASADGVAWVEDVDRVLMACGRRPNVEGLALTEAGVALDRGAIATDGSHRTSAPGVYAIGDVTGRVGSTHAAHAQGRRLVRRFLVPVPLLPEGPYPRVAFTDPEVATIGPGRAALERRYGSLVATVRVELAATDRGRVTGTRDGFVELRAMRGSGRVLSATVVAPGASELILPLVRAVRRRETMWGLSRLVAPYPTFGEAIRRAADEFVFEALPQLHRELGHYLRHRWRRRAPSG